MKKYSVALVLLGLFVVTPVLAQTGAERQSFWQKLLDFFGQTEAEQTAVVVVSQKNTTTVSGATPVSNIDTIPTIPTIPNTPVEPIPENNGCGQTLTPRGTINQTIRCNGQNWVAAGNLLNDGVNVGVGGLNSDIKLYVIGQDDKKAIVGKVFGGEGDGEGDGVGVTGLASGQSSRGVHGSSGGTYGIGVNGEANGNDSFAVRGENANASGVGVYGASDGTGVVGKSPSGIAVRAVSSTGFGFYQTGAQVKNYFEGSLLIGDDSDFHPDGPQLYVDVPHRDAIRGRSQDGLGVVGVSQTNVGVRGHSLGGTGVFGKSDAQENGVGVFGQGPNDNYGIGVRGWGVTGVSGEATNGSGLRVGVKGTSQGPNNVGVLGSIGGPDSNSETAIAVKASTVRTNGGVGFYQEGTSAKNNFEGTLSLGYVNGPTLAPGVSMQVPAGLRIFPNTGVARPACNNASNTRGTFWVSLGVAGASDSVEVCIRNADGTYGWRGVF